MKIITFIFFMLTINFTVLTASPKISFEELVVAAEQNSQLVNEAHAVALVQNLPVTIMTSGGVIIDAKGVESGKVVYAVITDKADVFNFGYTAFYEEVILVIDISSSLIRYADGSVTDNTGGKYDYTESPRSGVKDYLMITDWTNDRVSLFSKENGDLIDADFIPPSPAVLGSPKMAMQTYNGGSILVSDQITDGVYEFDTSGAYINIFAPAGGVNVAILDNIRGIRYRANNNLLVCVASGASSNTIQQFDTAGISMGAFIGTNLNSPFDILLRSNDMLITNSSGSDRITRFDLDGNFLSSFYTGSNFAFPQQLQRLPNGNILVAAFSTPSGIAMLDSSGNFLRLLTGTTGLRSVFLLDNGNYLVTNGSGVHEVDSINGTPLRTIVSGASYQYITLYTPGTIVSIGNNNTGVVNKFELSQNYPNPFNPVTNISYNLLKKEFVKIMVTDITGKEIKVLVNQVVQEGRHMVTFSGEGLASGIYYYSIEAGNFKESKKMILLK